MVIKVKKRFVIIGMIGIIGLIALLSNSVSAGPIIGSEMMNETHHLLFSGAQQNKLPQGWEIKKYTIYSTEITVLLKSIDNETIEITLCHKRECDFRGVFLGNTKSFKVFQSAEGEKKTNEASIALFKRLHDNDRTYFFALHDMEVSESYFEFILSKHKKILFIFVKVMLIVLFLLSSKIIIQSLGNDKQVFLFFICVFLMGTFIRAAFSPGAPIHCNTHGIREVRGYLGSSSQFYNLEHYGHVFPSAMRKMLEVIGVDEKNVFNINILFGSLAIISIFVLGLVVYEEGYPAIILAAIYALSPSQIWMAGSESQIPMFHCFSFFGIALAIIGFRRDNLPVFWFGAIIVIYASMFRILTIMVVPVLIVFLIYELKIYHFRDELRKRKNMINNVLAWFMVAIFFVSIHYKNMEGMTSKGWDESSPYAIKEFFFSYRNILWDPTLTPVVIPMLLVIGLYYILKRNIKFGVLSLVLFLILVPLTFTVLDCRTTTLRYQSPAHWVYYIIAAYVFTSSIWKSRVRMRMFFTLAFSILLLATSIPGIAMLKKGDEEINEYWFLREETKNIPQGTKIIMPVSNAIEGRLIPDFPDYMNALNVQIGIPEDGVAKSDMVYLGLDCYRYERDEELDREFTADGIRKECADFCGSQTKNTIIERRLDARYPNIGYQKRFFDISREFPTVGFYSCEDRDSM